MIPRFDFRYSFKDFLNGIANIDKSRGPDLTTLKNYYGGFSVTFVGKARVGLCLVLRALDLKPGSSIGVQPFTCSSVLFAIKKAGFNIVFIDIDHNLRLSHEDLRLKSNRIEALIATHTFGFPENISELKSILGNKPVIEDCAQAFLSQFNGKPLGLSGDAGVFSIGYGKLFGIGSGGFIVSKNNVINASLIKETEKLTYPNSFSVFNDSLKALVLGTLYIPAVYTIVTYPLKHIFKKDNPGLQEYPRTEQILSLPGISLFLSRFNDNMEKVRRQQENGRLLLSLIDERFHSIAILDESRPNFFLLPLQSRNRDKIISYLKGKGIEAGKHFSNSIKWVRSFGYNEGECPVFEQIAVEVFTLPCHYYLSEKKIRVIAESLNKYHEAN